MKDQHDVIIRPVLTEKSYDLLNQNTYTFVVRPTATKPEIKQAVEEVFGVQVKSVRTLHKPGKLKRQGRSEGTTPAVKKAYVTLTPASKKIEFFANMVQ